MSHYFKLRDLKKISKIHFSRTAYLNLNLKRILKDVKVAKFKTSDPDSLGVNHMYIISEFNTVLSTNFFTQKFTLRRYAVSNGPLKPFPSNDVGQVGKISKFLIEKYVRKSRLSATLQPASNWIQIC